MDYLQNILRLIKAAPGEQITDRECIEILLYTVDMAGMIVDKVCLLPSEDRRRKLTPEQKTAIERLKGSATIHSLAKEYGVSRRTIQFLWYPERRKANLLARQARGGWRQYYNKDDHRVAMADTRGYKKQILGV
jgi:transposase-like protein